MVVREPVWREPVRGRFVAADSLQRSGLEQLQGVRFSPPMSHLTGLEFVAAEPGSATFTLPVTEWLCWLGGAVPGGVLAVLVDAAMGCALQTMLPPQVQYTTAELSMTYLRPLRPGVALRATGRCLHAGSSVGFAITEVRDQDHALLAFCSTRCLIFSSDGDRPSRGGTAPPPLPPETSGGAVGVDPLDPYLRPLSDAAREGMTIPAGSGLETVRSQARGDIPLPPLHHLLGIAPAAAEDATASASMPFGGWLATPFGWPQGGFVALLADLAMALAVQTTMPEGGRFASLDAKVNFVRPVAGDGSPVKALATVQHRGRNLAIAEAELIDSDGRRVALASGSSAILR